MCFWLEIGVKEEIELSIYWTQAATHVHAGSQRRTSLATGDGMVLGVPAAPNPLEANDLNALGENKQMGLCFESAVWH